MMPSMLPGWNLPKNPFYQKNVSDLSVRFSKGGVLYIKGGDRPDLLRGPNPYGVVIDEYSAQDKRIWTEIIQPLYFINPEMFVYFLFTPRGKNHAFDIHQQGLTNPEQILISDLNIYQSGALTPEAIEAIKHDPTMSEMSFNQEFMCQFLEGEGSVFRHVRQIAGAKQEDPKQGHIYVMGVDLGKSHDYTVISVYDRSNNFQVYQDRFNQLEWPYQKAKIAAISSKYNNALVILDTTGLGAPIFDDLSRAGVPVQAFGFTNATKKQIIEKLSIYIEQKYLRIIPLVDTLNEFDSYEYEYTKSGLVSYNARPGTHDDIVIAHALAVSELTPLSKSAMTNDEPSRIQNYLGSLLTPKDPEQLLNEWADPNYSTDDIW